MSQTLAAQPSVQEIQKVYKLVEERKDVSALKECDAMLDKYPDSTFFLSFKALTLMNLGHRKESIQIIDDILAQPKVDFHDFIVRTLSMALERVNDYKRISELYERVCNAIPTQAITKYESTIEKYFYSLVRSNQLEKQQTTAAKLARHFPDNQLYNYWNICSMLLLGKEKPLLFKLAQKVLEKEFSLNSQDVKKLEGINYSERLRLYIESVLDVTGDYEGIINLLIHDEPWGKELEPLPYDRKAILATYCLKVEKYYTLANGIYAHLIQNADSDEWPWWTGIITSVLLMAQNGQTPSSFVEWEGKKLDCFTTISDLQKFIKSHQKGDKRGPYLAEMELIKVVRQKNLEFEFDAKPQDLILNYFKLFGSRKICYDDLKVYLELVSDQPQLLSNIYSSIDDMKVSELDKIEFQSTFFKIQRHTKQNVCSSTEDDLILKLISLYASSLPLGKDLHETDNQYGDEFLLIAAHYLLDKKDYVSTITLLELGLKRSKYNFHFKVLLIRVYSAVRSLSSRGFNIFMNDLDVKHIQFESISYLIYHDLMKIGVIDKAVKVADKILGFYHNEHVTYTSQYLALPYQKQSWSKIGEMTKFNQKLDSSFQIAKCQIDRLYLSLIFEDVRSARDISEHLIMIDLDDFIYHRIKSKNKEFSYNEDTSILKYFGSKELKNNVLIARELVERPDLEEAFTKLRIIELLADLISNREIVMTKPPVQPTAANSKKKTSEKENLAHAAKLKEHQRKVDTAKRRLATLKEKAEYLAKDIAKSNNVPQYCAQITNFIISEVSSSGDEGSKVKLLEECVSSFEAINPLRNESDLELLTRDIIWEISFFQFMYALLKDLGDKKYQGSVTKLKSALLSKATQVDSFIKQSRKNLSSITENTANHELFKPLLSYDWETTEKEIILDLNQQIHKGGFLNTKVEQIIGNIIFQHNK